MPTFDPTNTSNPRRRSKRIKEDQQKAWQTQTRHPHPCNDLDIWDDAESFDDLVRCNVLYLDRELDCTPHNFGPLDVESDMIRQAMKELCLDLHVLSTNSQPAYTAHLRRQRGYLVLMVHMKKKDIQGLDFDELGDAFREEDLDYSIYVDDNGKDKVFHEVGLLIFRRHGNGTMRHGTDVPFSMWHAQKIAIWIS